MLTTLQLLVSNIYTRVTSDNVNSHKFWSENGQNLPNFPSIGGIHLARYKTL